MLKGILYDAKVFLTLVLISILILFADNLKWLVYPKAFVQKITIPVQYGLYKSSQGLGKQFEFIALSRRASQQNKALS